LLAPGSLNDTPVRGDDANDSTHTGSGVWMRIRIACRRRIDWDTHVGQNLVNDSISAAGWLSSVGEVRRRQEVCMVSSTGKHDIGSAALNLAGVGECFSVPNESG